ncbi:hypothetical protein Pelo_4901 [Pelomyxa schiedti]|nr:hypothetical protein Pelo_4901 [Pelomyxa schiedti]
MRWWIPRTDEEIIGANQHFLVIKAFRDFYAVTPVGFEDFHVYYLQNMATGQRIFLSDENRPDGDIQTNGKWFVCTSSKELAVIKLPLTRLGTTLLLAISPTVVRLPKHHLSQLQFDGNCEDRLLLCFDDSLVLVDNAQTQSLKKLAVLSWTALQSEGELDMMEANVYVMTKQDCTHSFIAVDHHGDTVIAIEERTGKEQSKSGDSDWPTHTTHVSPVSQSEYCIFGDSQYQYQVLDVDDFPLPRRRMRCLPKCSAHDAFVEGGLLFQITKSGRKMFVTEECSGVNVITLKFFRPVGDGTTHSFVTVKNQSRWTTCIKTEEGTGQVQCKSEDSVWVTRISPVNQSEYCVFGDSKHKYEVWDINDLTTPKRRMRCLPECSAHDAFFEGGLLFQLTKSGRKIFVTEECSGVNVIAFEFLRDVNIGSKPSSLFLSGNTL